jgi:hypothetical protein
MIYTRTIYTANDFFNYLKKNDFNFFQIYVLKKNNIVNLDESFIS